MVPDTFAGFAIIHWEVHRAMRPAILILIIGVVVVLIGIGTGFIDINQIRGAQAPEISTTHNGVMAKGGQTPAFDVETGSVQVGTRESTVKVPAVKVVPPAEPAPETANTTHSVTADKAPRLRLEAAAQ